MGRLHQGVVVAGDDLHHLLASRQPFPAQVRLAEPDLEAIGCGEQAAPLLPPRHEPRKLCSGLDRCEFRPELPQAREEDGQDRRLIAEPVGDEFAGVDRTPEERRRRLVARLGIEQGQQGDLLALALNWVAISQAMSPPMEWPTRQ
jgi:hypothetical protein